MTPAQAMHDAFWDEGMGRKVGWMTDPNDQAKWETLADRGLRAARILHADGKRGRELHQATADALANGYWDIEGQPPIDGFDFAGFRAAFVPAAAALISMARAHPASRQSQPHAGKVAA